MKYNFGIRVDMGEKVGSGHFYRCLALAQEFSRKKMKTIFLITNKQEFLKHIQKLPFPYYVLKGNSEQEIIDNCKTILPNIEKLIVDLPLRNSDYSKEFSSTTKVAILDDVGNKTIYSDLLVNGSAVKKYHNYKILSKKTKRLIGPKFMILRKEFADARNRVKIKKEPIKKILLTFGGTDDADITRSLSLFLVNHNFKITVVIGPSYSHKQDLKNFANQHNFTIKDSVIRIADLFSKQDLVISSSGLTSYELACLGIPSIFIPIDEEQKPTSKTLQKLGFGVYYGFWDQNFKKLEKILSEINDYSLRKKMFVQGRKILDGKGLNRVVKNLLEL